MDLLGQASPLPQPGEIAQRAGFVRCTQAATREMQCLGT